MQQGQEQAQPLVGDGLQPQPVLQRVHGPPLAREQLEVPRQRADLPGELLGGRGRHPVVGARPGLEEHPVAAARDAERDEHIVEERIVRDRLE